MDKSNALAMLEKEIVEQGYEKDSVIKNYKYLDNNKKINTADLVVFGDPSCFDLRSSCIAIGWIDNEKNIGERVSSLRNLATPLILLPGIDDVKIYDFRNNEQLNNVSYQLLQKYFSINRLNYAKDSLMMAKRMTLFVQRTLFAIDATKELLVDLFERVILSEQKRLKDEHNSEITKVAIHVLAACIIEDKLWANEAQSKNAHELLFKCASTYKNYFKGILGNDLNEEIAENIYQSIRDQLTFGALTNNILGYFYEYAILDDNIRNSLGIHWTDESIAKLICRNLPIEFIPVSKRSVLDGTCGSGSLLVAACNRMADLLSAKIVGQSRHDWLTERIKGVEIEQFSSEIAKLSLLLYSLPYGNKWDIINSDFRTVDIIEDPSVIVGNPPFKESRTGEYATSFIKKYINILQPGGIMGIILPASFFESKNCKEARKLLLENTRLYEIWYLPEGAFRTSQIATAVVLLNKLSLNQKMDNYYVKIIEVDKDNLEHFKHSAEPSRVYFTESNGWLNSQDYRIVSSFFDRLLCSIKYKKKIGDVASIGQGIIPGINAEFGIKEMSCKDGAKCVKWLQSPGDGILQPYYIEWKDYRNKKRLFTIYPGKHQWPRSIPFDQPKVLINSVRNSSSKWRIYGAIDTKAYYASQGFEIIYNIDKGVSYEEIVSVINNPISSLFITKYNRRSYINEDVVRNIPFPTFNNKQKNILLTLVHKIMEIKNERKSEWEKCARKIVLNIDEVVFDAFKLAPSMRQELMEYISNNQRPGNEWRTFLKDKTFSEESERKETWRIIGVINSIDLRNNYLTLTLDEYKEHQKIPIPKQIPGWALENNQEVEVEVPFEQRYEADLKNVEIIAFHPLQCFDEEMMVANKPYMIK